MTALDNLKHENRSLQRDAACSLFDALESRTSGAIPGSLADGPSRDALPLEAVNAAPPLRRPVRLPYQST